MRIIEKKVIRQVGNIRVSERRFPRVLEYVRYKYPALFQEFSESHVIARRAIHSLDSDPEFQDFVVSLIDANLEDILWFYEGTYLLNRCYRLLSIRPRSRKELQDFLALHADNTETIALVISRLEPLIDDKEFAEYLVQKERAHNPKGDIVIKKKLKEKGIADDIIEEALQKDKPDVMELIQAQYNKKASSLWSRIQHKGSANMKREFREKMTAYLLTKGFSLSDTQSFLKNHNNEKNPLPVDA